MNTIKWNQVGTLSFSSEGELFAVYPAPDGRWTLYSKQKGKMYFYPKMEGAFEGARNIHNFYRNGECANACLRLSNRGIYQNPGQ